MDSLLRIDLSIPSPSLSLSPALSLSDSLACQKHPLPFDLDDFRHTSALLRDIERKTAESYPASRHMLTGMDQGTLLALFSGFLGAVKVLDMGTFTGYSALSLALGVSRKVCHVFSILFSWHSFVYSIFWGVFSPAITLGRRSRHLWHSTFKDRRRHFQDDQIPWHYFPISWWHYGASASVWMNPFIIQNSKIPRTKILISFLPDLSKRRGSSISSTWILVRSRSDLNTILSSTMGCYHVEGL